MKQYRKIVVLIFSVLLYAKVFAGDTLIYFAKSVALPGSAWKYLDNNTSLDGVAWKDSLFIDATWNTANSEFGYGDGDENTIVNDGCLPQGSNCVTKFVTTYFRKTFYISNPTHYTSFTLQYKRDDGIEIFINGIRYEINNLTDPVLHASLASSAGDDGETVFSINIPVTAFYGNGKKNVIAVDIHQTLASSSDISFDLQLIGNTNALLTRGPYLQMGKQDSISIRWRTDVATDSKVTWGTVFGVYPNSFTDAVLTTEHELRIGGLTADTKYFYSIGGMAFTLQATPTNYFYTLPADNATRKLRFIAVGDCGNASANQVNVKNTYLNFIGSENTDAMILLGDNAYSSGLDIEYQTGFFDIYKDDFLRNIKLYPAPGNHDYGNTQANAAVRNNDYYKNFSMPDAGQIGGVPSGTEAYYSFNIGNVHFVSLDSYGKEDANSTRLYDTLGAQVTWLKNDLNANTKTFTIVYFHHPPYTKTSHNSDSEGELINIRENFIRILERYGVDVVMCGHSHGYERSYLLRGFYNNSVTPLLDADFDPSLHTATGNQQNALYNGAALACPYVYNSGRINHGTVYTVAGSAGQLGGISSGYPHNAMFYSNETNGGLLYFEVDSNRLDAKFISYNTASIPSIKDQFTIIKDVNKTANINVLQNTPLTLTASWRGTYYWPYNGSTNQSISIPTGTAGNFSYIVKDAFSGNCLKDSFRVTVTSLLPVNLIDFTAGYQNDAVVLKWQTAMEQNSLYFIIEKSVDAINFQYFKTVTAAGFSNLNTNYSIIDDLPHAGLNFYRLTVVNSNRSRQLLGVRKVNWNTANNFSVKILNTAKGVVDISISGTRSNSFYISVYDISGRKLVERKEGRIFSLSLTPGNYCIALINEEGKIINDKFSVL